MLLVVVFRHFHRIQTLPDCRGYRTVCIIMKEINNMFLWKNKEITENEKLVAKYWLLTKYCSFL